MSAFPVLTTKCDYIQPDGRGASRRCLTSSGHHTVLKVLNDLIVYTRGNQYSRIGMRQVESLVASMSSPNISLEAPALWPPPIPRCVAESCLVSIARTSG